MQIEFTNQVAAVTGGAGGIGYTCAKTLLESGAAVVILLTGVWGSGFSEASFIYFNF